MFLACVYGTVFLYFTLMQLNDVLFPIAATCYLCSAFLTALFTCCIGRCFEEEYIYPV